MLGSEQLRHGKENAKVGFELLSLLQASSTHNIVYNELPGKVFVLMSRYNQVSITLVFIGVLLAIILVWRLPAAERNLINVTALVGSIASAFGLLIAVLQILSLKKITEATQEAVQETKDKLRRVISLSDVSRAIKLIEEIQNYASEEKYQLARLRLQDLRSLLLQFSGNADFGEIVEPELYERFLEDVNLSVVNLYDIMVGRKKRFDHSKLNQTLEKIVTILIQLENKLKFE